MKKIYIFFDDDIINVDRFMFDGFGNKVKKLELNNTFDFDHKGTKVYLLEIKSEIIMKNSYSKYIEDDKATFLFLNGENDVIDYLSVDYDKIENDYFITKIADVEEF